MGKQQDTPVRQEASSPIACNICGGRLFTEGPAGRKSPGTGKLPQCVSCGSLERHRFLRGVWNRLSRDEFRDMKALQFSMDPTVEKCWFKSLEISVFEGKNSLDLQNINRPDGAYEIIICNHILEHVEKDRQAFRELMRILKPGGFLQFSLPLPRKYAVTKDWGYPKPEQHQHYRIYGRDLVQRFSEAQPGVQILEFPGVDDVTDVPDFVYFASFDNRRVSMIHSQLSVEQTD